MHSQPWLSALLPVDEPAYQPIRPGSDVSVWHVEIAFEAWQLPEGQVPMGKDNWNGKALVKPQNSTIERSVGEVEVVERLRAVFLDVNAYWTAGIQREDLECRSH